MTKPTPKTLTVHGVLADAMRGRRAPLDNMLYHASVDGGRSALCGKVSHLCDEYGTPVNQVVTCTRCQARIGARMKPTLTLMLLLAAAFGSACDPGPASDLDLDSDSERTYCAQVVTRARPAPDAASACESFPTPCDVPFGWELCPLAVLD